MTPSRPVVSVAPLLFVFAPDGQVETVGGFAFDPDEIVRRGTMRIDAAELTRGGGAALDRVLVAEIAERLRDIPCVSITSRLRPLMPRLGRGMQIVLPMWALARIDLDGVEGDDWMAHARRHPHGLGATARLSESLADPDLEREAEGEFRRALAGDPMANRLTGEDARMRTLSVDELARAGRHGEAPPVLAMLPRLFTIDELRLAVARITRVPEERVESSSNFRRRVQELLAHGVLQPVGEAARGWAKSSPVVPEEVDAGTRPGRRPTLYEFDESRWRRWLLHRAGGAEEVARREVAPMARKILEREARDEAPWESGVRMSASMQTRSSRRIERESSRRGSVLRSAEAAVPIDPLDARSAREGPQEERQVERSFEQRGERLSGPRGGRSARDAEIASATDLGPLDMACASLPPDRSPTDAPGDASDATAPADAAPEGLLDSLRAAEERLEASERRLAEERESVLRVLADLRAARGRARAGEGGAAEPS
ncbi:MAG: hypothetical protein RI967_559 [Planctomycetota bacterium]